MLLFWKAVWGRKQKVSVLFCEYYFCLNKDVLREHTSSFVCEMGRATLRKRFLEDSAVYIFNFYNFQSLCLCPKATLNAYSRLLSQAPARKWYTQNKWNDSVSCRSVSIFGFSSFLLALFMCGMSLDWVFKNLTSRSRDFTLDIS